MLYTILLKVKLQLLHKLNWRFYSNYTLLVTPTPAGLSPIKKRTIINKPILPPIHFMDRSMRKCRETKNKAIKVSANLFADHTAPHP